VSRLHLSVQLPREDTEVHLSPEEKGVCHQRSVFITQNSIQIVLPEDAQSEI